MCLAVCGFLFWRMAVDTSVSNKQPQLLAFTEKLHTANQTQGQANVSNSGLPRDTTAAPSANCSIVKSVQLPLPPSLWQVPVPRGFLPSGHPQRSSMLLDQALLLMEAGKLQEAVQLVDQVSEAEA